MFRTLLACLALLCLTDPAFSDTPQNPTETIHATMFIQARLDTPPMPSINTCAI
jgi:hypothetical protein